MFYYGSHYVATGTNLISIILRPLGPSSWMTEALVFESVLKTTRFCYYTS